MRRLVSRNVGIGSMKPPARSVLLDIKRSRSDTSDPPQALNNTLDAMMSGFSDGMSSFNIITISITVRLCRYLHAQVAAVSIAHLDIKIMQRYNARKSRHTEIKRQDRDKSLSPQWYGNRRRTLREPRPANQDSIVRPFNSPLRRYPPISQEPCIGPHPTQERRNCLSSPSAEPCKVKILRLKGLALELAT